MVSWCNRQGSWINLAEGETKMSTSFWRRSLLLVATLTVFASLSQSVEASLQLVLDGDLEASAASGMMVSFSGSKNGFDIEAVLGSSNSSGGPTQSRLNITTLIITNTNATTETLTILVGDTGFLFPAVGPASLSSGVGGSITTTTADNKIEYQTWVNASNVQNAMSPGITSGSLMKDLSGLGDGDSFGGAIDGLQNRVGGSITATPFSMTGLVTVTLGAGGQLNFASTAVLTPVPEPGTVAMAFAGVPFLALGYYRHRRRARA